MVEAEPPWPLDRTGPLVHRDDLQADVGPESRQRVVRGHTRMFPARAGSHSERSLDVGSASLEGRRDDGDVIEAGDHGGSGT